MKRIFTYLIIVLFVISCREKEVLPDVDADVIAFAIPDVLETKSVLIEEVGQMEILEGKLGFSVFGARYILGSEGEKTRHEQFMDDLKVYSEDDGDTWKYDGETYYWSPGASHKFFAMYPYYNHESDVYDLGIEYEIDQQEHALKVTGKDKGVICTGFDADGKNLCPDILYGVQYFPEPYKIGENREKIRFVMSHALAAVSFRLRNASDHPIVSVTNIDPERDHIYLAGFDNTSDKVLLKENQVKWGERRDNDPYAFAISEISSLITSGAYYKSPNSEYWFTALMIPQNFAGYDESPSLSFKVAFGGTSNSTKEYTINFKDYAVHSTAETAFSFLPGYHYEYNINVTEKSVYCDVKIVPWIEDEPIKLN